MKKIILAVVLFSAPFAFAQEKVKYTKEQTRVMDNDLFDTSFTGFSPKKEATIVLKNGKTVQGLIKDMDHKKGMVYSVEIKNSATGKNEKYASTEISEATFPVSGLEKGLKMASFGNSISKWGSKDPKKTTNVNEVHFVNQSASIRNKTEGQEYLMQLINPNFSEKIQVFADPRASETSGVSFGGGPQIGGGVIKSYYVKKGDKIVWLKKADFEENYNWLFGDNAEFMKKYPANSVEWKYFSFLVNEYNDLSSK